MNSQLLTTTAAVDPVFTFIFGASLVLLVGITAAMVLFVIRYRRSRCPEPTSEAEGNFWLELVWTLLPTLLVLAMFYYGWKGYLTLRQVPDGALPVTAVARMWSWSFRYQNGKTSGKLVVPVGKPVVVWLESKDVLHGFYLPAFRVKRDVVPGMKNRVWFVATKAGSYDIFCSQYCGTGHSSMIGTVEAVPEAQFGRWLQEEEGGEHEGQEVLERYGCLGCHSLDGSPKTGPSLQGIWGRKVTVLTNGRERVVTADEGYLRRSILEPGADLVKGFPPVMPPFAKVISPEELNAVLRFLRMGGQGAAPRLDGAQLAKEKGCLGCHSLDGTPGVGPSFKGLFGKKEQVARGGAKQAVEVDEAYLRESILQPQAAVVEGYQPIMPSFGDLTPAQLNALVEFIEAQR